MSKRLDIYGKEVMRKVDTKNWYATRRAQGLDRWSYLFEQIRRPLMLSTYYRIREL